MTPRRKDSQSTDKSRKEDDEQSNDSSDMSNEDDGGSESESKIEGENGQESANASDEEEDDEGSSSDEDAEPVVLNVTERAKRATAGNKMAALLASADQEDEFYKTAYGGFEENNEVDKEFKSPVHSDDDDVDSDFDKPEEEDESVSGGEEDGQPRRKKRKFNEPKRGMTADDILSKNKKWAMSRLAGNMVPANTVDDRTQAAMLKEAESTEKMNVESLKKYEEFELERKKRREKNSVRVFPPGPREQIKMTATGTTVTVSEIKPFKCDRPRERNLCAVTGRPARYMDPVTNLPYSTPYAFKVIRDRYHKHLRTLRGNEEVNSYLASLKALPTPPMSPRTSTVKPGQTTSGATAKSSAILMKH
ncbi:hypothetical protein L5515_000987 [Caenorhabditis briggsae]|uniref:Vacuolar protein sorting-associated protein 72 homolog n=1 Tax=Caenorhabditis briggsae TaxID=6238 RepID=A0AAE9E276_CAEBR|nr:hypothetical protein L5515_000987 [Caenorhabditis briggsae]